MLDRIALENRRPIDVFVFLGGFCWENVADNESSHSVVDNCVNYVLHIDPVLVQERADVARRKTSTSDAFPFTSHNLDDCAVVRKDSVPDFVIVCLIGAFAEVFTVAGWTMMLKINM